jgi:hypothetical protein
VLVHIKEINREFNKNSEPMVDESGIRNFHTADENPDFLRAINYMERTFERHGRNITRLFYINGYKVE